MPGVPRAHLHFIKLGRIMRIIMLLIVNTALFLNQSPKVNLQKVHFNPQILQYENNHTNPKTKEINFSSELQRKKIEMDLLNRSV